MHESAKTVLFKKCFHRCKSAERSVGAAQRESGCKAVAGIGLGESIVEPP